MIYKKCKKCGNRLRDGVCDNKQCPVYGLSTLTQILLDKEGKYK